MNPQEKINQMKQVMADTEGKTDLVSQWARKGVKSEAGSNISYLQRRLNDLYADFPHDVATINNAEEYIKQLTPIFKGE